MPNLQLEKDDSQQKETGNAPAVADSKGPLYPSGLNLYLDADTVEKLGLDGCEVGGVYDISAKGKVTSISENDGEGQEYSKTITIQITDMDVEEGASDDGNEIGQADKEKEVMDKMEGLMKPSIAYVMKKK